MTPATAAIPQKVGKKLWKKAVGSCECAALGELHKKEAGSQIKLSADKSNQIDDICSTLHRSKELLHRYVNLKTNHID